MSSAPGEPQESSHPAPSEEAEEAGGTWSTADFVVGRGVLLVIGPVVVALFWVFGALPAWGAAALGGFLCAVAVVFLVRLRVRSAAAAAEGARVLVVGGGYAGLVAARALQARLPGGTRGGRHLGPGDASTAIAGITVVDPQAHMTYQPFLPEAAAGAIEPRHLTVPLRRVLRRCDVITGSVAAIDDASRRAVVSLPDGGTREIGYDVLVVAPGTSPRRLPIPGLDERALPFRSVTDALALRDHVLSRLDAASSTTDPAERRRLLTFTVIGGGFAGLEVLGELEDMTRRAAKHQPGHIAEEIQWVLLEAAGRIMPEVSPALAARVHAQLLRRGIEVRVGAKITSAEGGRVVLAGGPTFATDTIVVAAGSVPNPLLERTDLPLDPRGRVRCATTLQVRDRAHVFTAGDCAAVPDVTVPVPRDGEPVTTAPTAQHAVRQARLLARNVDAFLAGRLLRGYRHQNAGAVAGLGRRRGAAQIGPLRVTGWPAFALHRAYHLWAVPTADRTVRIALDWVVSGLLGRDLVAVGRRDAAPLPDTDAPPTVAPRVADAAPDAAPDPAPATRGEGAEDLPTGATPVVPTWGADPSVTGPRRMPSVPSAPFVPPTPPSGTRVPTGSATDSQGIPAMQMTRSGSFESIREPHPSLPFGEPFSVPFSEPFSEPLPSDPFREPTPSLAFGEPSGAFREPHPSFPSAPRGSAGTGVDAGPRAPYPSTTKPRHSLRDTN
ncbi:NAD(P)/FAD-dependent oxidoreductase [Actinomycetospora straminea]|uniref:FAD/NAD(P)-binding domain-containing protein n=1 Tax=Actinomycetospora straminea TaxID=663607 RepID=A0ABP9F203_9PSEU|nr:FAD-dependent oxidoreductase [Actinomycetospora straminea]MDD7932829.1 FAD-dependent oxidoreductase [Actinomycetospora straminea]